MSYKFADSQLNLGDTKAGVMQFIYTERKIEVWVEGMGSKDDNSCTTLYIHTASCGYCKLPVPCGAANVLCNATDLTLLFLEHCDKQWRELAIKTLSVNVFSPKKMNKINK